MFLTGKTLPRRAVLRGIGATIALPFLDAMIPVRLRAFGATARRGPLRLVCIEQVHGAAGSSIYGAQQNLWAPAATGRAFDLSTSSLKPLDPWREPRVAGGQALQVGDAAVQRVFPFREYRVQLGGRGVRNFGEMPDHVADRQQPVADVVIDLSRQVTDSGAPFRGPQFVRAGAQPLHHVVEHA